MCKSSPFIIAEPLESRTLLALAAGFEQVKVAGISTTTATQMEFAPDGRLFVIDSNNRQVRVIKNGALSGTICLSFTSSEVDRASERGIESIAFDPHFATNKFVYLYYTKPDPAAPNTAPSNAMNRLVRYKMSTSNPDVIDKASGVVLLDNILNRNGNHNGGAMHFGADGMLYLGVGEGGGSTQTDAQDLSKFGGKILRLNVAAVGATADPVALAPTSNPFYNAADGITARDYIFAYGVRNPFTGAIKPGTNTLYINDVGQNTWEEIDHIQAGKNYGWPNAEGNSTNSAFTNPIYEYTHFINGTGVSSAITGGVFYSGSQFPASYQGKYFFADYLRQFIKVLDPATNQVSDFYTNAPSDTLNVVDLDVAPDGTLWTLSLTGTIRKYSFVNQSGTNLAPRADAFVRDGASAGTNFGSATTLVVKKSSTVGNTRETDIKFDLTGIAAGAGQTIKLRMWGKLSDTVNNNLSVGVYPVADATWGESTITWNNRPAAGATALATKTISGTTLALYEWDVTNYVRNEKTAGRDGVAFALKRTTATDTQVLFNSDEAGSNRPVLFISAPVTQTTISTTIASYVRGGIYASQNFGNDATLLTKLSASADNIRESFIKFDLSSVSSITSAKLRLFGKLSSSGSVTVGAYSSTNTSWTEGGVTYNNRPATSGGPLATATLNSTTGAFYEWNITAFLQSEKAAGHNLVTIALKATAITDPWAIFDADSSANGPQIVVT